MKILSIIGLAAVAFVVFGCSQPTTPAETKPAAQNTTPNNAPPESGGGAQIHGAGAGSVAPVTGTENLQGGGGGVNQSAKERAKSVGGGSSLDQLQSEGD